MSTSRGFTRRSRRQLVPADGNCFYNSVIAAASAHPLFAPGELARRVAVALGVPSQALTMDALKTTIVESPQWQERVLGMVRAWFEMDRALRRELLDQYTDQFPAFIQYVSTHLGVDSDATATRSGGGGGHSTLHHAAHGSQHGRPSAHVRLRRYMQHMARAVMANGSFATENEVSVLVERLRTECDVILRIHMDRASIGDVPFGTRATPHLHILWRGVHYDAAVCDARCPDGFQDCSNERFNPHTDWHDAAPCIPRVARCTAREDELPSTTEKRSYVHRASPGRSSVAAPATRDGRGDGAPPSIPTWQWDCLAPDARASPRKRAHLLRAAQRLEPNGSFAADDPDALCRWHADTHAHFRAEKAHAMRDARYHGCGASEVDPHSGLTMDAIPPTVFGVYPDVTRDGEPYTTCGDLRRLHPFVTDVERLPRSRTALPDTAEWNERLSDWRARIDYHRALDEYEAIDHAETTAERHFQLGHRHLYGEGVPVDANEAVKWLRASAEQGHARAQALLGVCYALGEGVEADTTTSDQWLRTSAEQGNTLAQDMVRSIHNLA